MSSTIEQPAQRLKAAADLVGELEAKLKDAARKHGSIGKREAELRQRVSETDAQIASLTSRYDYACRAQLSDRAGEDPRLLKRELDKLQDTRHGLLQLLADAEKATWAAHAPVHNLQRQLEQARADAELAALNLKVNQCAEELVAAREVWDQKELAYRKAQGDLRSAHARRMYTEDQLRRLAPGQAQQQPFANPDPEVRARNLGELTAARGLGR